ncbi:MAG: outer membrane lipoprotein-sorting protein [Candidatus Zixiibacteriota bacterium]
MKYSAYFAVAVLLVAVALPGVTAGQDSLTIADIKKIIKEVDDLYRSKSSFSKIEMEIVTPHWQRTLKMEAWTEGLEKTFIRINEPKKEAGVATLRIGNQMWNYLPKTNKVIKIPPSMMMSSWMGSDFTNDDLVKEFSLFEDYSYEQTTVENPEKGVIYINCIPKPDLPIVWGNIMIAVHREGYIPLWQKYYDEKGNLMRVLSYSDIKTFDGRTIPATMTMVPQNEEGHKTVIRYDELKFNIALPEDVFTLRNLRSQ